MPNFLCILILATPKRSTGKLLWKCLENFRRSICDSGQFLWNCKILNFFYDLVMNQFFRKIVKECHFLAACALFLIVLIIKMFDNVAYSVLCNIFFFLPFVHGKCDIMCTLCSEETEKNDFSVPSDLIDSMKKFILLKFQNCSSKTIMLFDSLINERLWKMIKNEILRFDVDFFKML